MKSEKEIRDKLRFVKAHEPNLPEWVKGWLEALEWVLEDSPK